MSSLPISPLAKGTVDINGSSVAFRSLSRAEAISLRGFEGQTSEAEAFIVSAATGVSLDEARTWFTEVDTKTGAILVDAILELSGLLPSRRSSSKPSSGG